MELKGSDRFFIVGAALRYAIGRMTMMPSYIIGFIMKHQDEFETSELQSFYKDVNHAIEDDRVGLTSLGHDIDRKEWYQFCDALKEVINGRQDSVN